MIMDCLLAAQQGQALAELGNQTLFLTYLFGGPAGPLLSDFQIPLRVNRYRGIAHQNLPMSAMPTIATELLPRSE
jgi:hypothetical protein